MTLDVASLRSMVLYLGAGFMLLDRIYCLALRLVRLLNAEIALPLGHPETSSNSWRKFPVEGECSTTFYHSLSELQ